jgi:hypothetical protein
MTGFPARNPVECQHRKMLHKIAAKKCRNYNATMHSRFNPSGAPLYFVFLRAHQVVHITPTIPNCQ